MNKEVRKQIMYHLDSAMQLLLDNEVEDDIPLPQIVPGTNTFTTTDLGERFHGVDQDSFPQEEPHPVRYTINDESSPFSDLPSF